MKKQEASIISAIGGATRAVGNFGKDFRRTASKVVQRNVGRAKNFFDERVQQEFQKALNRARNKRP